MSDTIAVPEAEMDCARVIHDEIAEQYVAGRLSDSDAAAFEHHYFTCDRCFADVEAWRTMGAALAPGSAAPARPIRSRAPWWLWAAAAVLLLSAALIRYWPSRNQPVGQLAVGSPSPGPPTSGAPGTPPGSTLTLAALSVVEPPAYVPLRVRGTSDDAVRRFGEAMTRYEAGDYAGAIPGLEAAAALDHELVQAPFYLGACLLLTGDAAHAIERFAAVIALGESGYLEGAHYLLAKAQLRVGDATAARVELTKVVALHGDREADAKKLLEDLGKLGGSGGRRQ